MSATMVTCARLTCDEKQCARSFRAHDVRTFDEAREYASRAGWTHDPVDKQDWCPEHTAVGEFPRAVES